MLLYFTSGTTGYPKMVCHDFSYPIAHIVTAKYWHNVDPDGLHLTVSETGWAKSGLGKLYGQWFLAAGIFVYDFDKSSPPTSSKRSRSINSPPSARPPPSTASSSRKGWSGTTSPP